MAQEYFSIALNSEISLAIPLDSIGEIIQLDIQGICTVPGVSAFWYGVINFKGSLLWILDSDRYFNLKSKRDRVQSKKIASVIIKSQQQDSFRQVAITTLKLEGIIAIESQQLEPLPEHTVANLKDCCSNVISAQNKHTFILNSADLLEQLHQQSSLLSA